MIRIQILEEYGTELECIQGKRNIVEYLLSMLTITGNQDTTQDTTYTKENMPEINDIKGLP